MANFLNLQAFLGLNASGFKLGMKQVDSQAKSTAAGIKMAFAAAFGPAALIAAAAKMGAEIKKIVDYGGKVHDQAARMSITTEEVQALGYAAEQTGASIEDMASALKKIAVARSAALGGDSKARSNFAEYGIDLDMLKSSAPNLQLFRQISDVIKGAGDSTKYMASMLALMGKSADSLIPAMKEGIGGMIDNFDRLGLAIDKSVIDRLDKVGDKLNDLKSQSKTTFANVLVGGFESAKLLLKGLFSGKETVKGSLFKTAPFEELQEAMMGTLSDAIKGLGGVSNSKRPWEEDTRFKGVNARMFDATPEKEKKLRNADKPEVNNWQKLGGLVMSADRPLNNIEKNTRKAADALDAIKKGGGFSAAKPKETIF